MKYRGTQLSAWHHMSHKLERFTVWLFRENTCQSGLDSSAWTFFSSPMGTLLSSVNCLQTPRRLIFSGSFLGESCAHKWTVSSFHIGFTCSVPLPQAETSSSTPWCSQPLHTHAHTHKHNTKTKVTCIRLEHCVTVRLWGHGRSLHCKNHNLKLIIGHSSPSRL